MQHPVSMRVTSIPRQVGEPADGGGPASWNLGMLGWAALSAPAAPATVQYREKPTSVRQRRCRRCLLQSKRGVAGPPAGRARTAKSCLSIPSVASARRRWFEPFSTPAGRRMCEEQHWCRAGSSSDGLSKSRGFALAFDLRKRFVEAGHVGGRACRPKNPFTPRASSPMARTATSTSCPSGTPSGSLNSMLFPCTTPCTTTRMTSFPSHQQDTSHDNAQQLGTHRKSTLTSGAGGRRCRASLSVFPDSSQALVL